MTRRYAGEDFPDRCSLCGTVFDRDETRDQLLLVWVETPKGNDVARMLCWKCWQTIQQAIRDRQELDQQVRVRPTLHENEPRP
jgi:hypothetical protein